jgi:hypothetical protein
MRPRVRMFEDMRCLLRAGLDERLPAASAWQRWKQLRDLDTVTWEEHKGLARIAVRLIELDPQCRYRPRLQGLAKAHWTQSQIMLRAGVPALRTLVDAGLEVMLLKGCAMQVLVPQSTGPRVTSDLDILVTRADFPRAIRLLHADGWAGRNSMEYAMASWRFKAGQGLRGGQYGNIDVHHQPLHGERIANEVLEGMWLRSSRTLFHGVSVRVPAVADLVVCTAGHAMHAIARGERALARFFDLMDLVSHPDFDADVVAEVAQQFAVSPVVAAAFRHLDNVIQDARVTAAIKRLEARPGALAPWVRYFAGTLDDGNGVFVQRLLDRLWPESRTDEREEDVVPRVRVSGRKVPAGRHLGLDAEAACMAVRHEVMFGDVMEVPQELVISILCEDEPGGHVRFDVSTDGRIHSRLLGSVKSGGVLRFRLPPVPSGVKSLAITALPAAGREGAPRFSLAAVSFP